MKKINIDLKNKKDLIKLGVMFVVFAVILVIIFSLFNSKKLVCTLDNELISGFKNEEDVTFILGGGEIKSIDYDRKISINDYYKNYGTYIDSLENILTTGYKYMKNKDIETTDNSIAVSFKTRESGIVLNNLSIVYNNDTDDTSLRYDILSDIENDENSFKVGDKYSKKELKNAIKKLGYSCK